MCLVRICTFRPGLYRGANCLFNIQSVVSFYKIWVIYIEKRKGIHINDKNNVNENKIFDILVLQQDAVEMKLLYTPHTSTSFLHSMPVFATVTEQTSMIFFPLAQQPNTGQGGFIIEVFGSHTMTPQSLGLLQTVDRP